MKIRASCGALGAVWSLAALTQALADSHEAITVQSFVGCWMTAAPAPIVILSGGNKPDGYQIFHEDMLLTVERIAGTELVKGHYYVFSADPKHVIGPEYVDGAFNPVEGVLTVGEPEGGLNRVHIVSPDRILYVHTKAAATADMSVRRLDRMECADADAKAKELDAAR